jgi:hypothetical protein
MPAGFPRLVCAAVAVVTTLLIDSAVAEPPRNITIDGKFGDWASVPSHSDARDDQHDTDHDQQSDTPGYVDHPDVDLLEYKFTHSRNNLYAYFRARGKIGRTQTGALGTAGRYYAIVTIDVDDDVSTGYWLHEGGYYPTSNGYDMNMEAEFYGGSLNTVHYLSHDALDEFGLMLDFLDLTEGGYGDGYPITDPGPYPAGTATPAAGNYANYTQWVYHPDDTLTLVQDKGAAYTGIATVALSGDGRQLEMCAPFKGFLTDSSGNPNVALGRTVNISFSLEASGELAPGRMWGSDTADPIIGYRLDAPAPGNVRSNFDQGSGRLTITGDAQGNNVAILSEGSLITVVGLTGTTINGGGVAAYVAGRKQSVTIDLGGGEDAITLEGLESDGVTASLGAGDDSITIMFSTIKSLKLDGGAGRDQFSSLFNTIGSQKITGFE